jgi:predicted ATPase with chaperone activity
MMPMIATDPIFHLPSAPRTLAETGLSSELVLQMVAKTLHFAGELTGSEVATRLGVNFPIIEAALDQLKRQRHCEIVGGGLVGAPAYQYRLTDSGRSLVTQFLESNQYVGHLPVTVEDYRAYMREFGRDSVKISSERIRKAFQHLVLNNRVLDQLGPAIAARHSLFLYGPAGNGKTVISQSLRNVLASDIAIPHALALDNHIIRLFDPVNHEPIEPGFQTLGLERRPDIDFRWVHCRRPLISVAGELTMDALDLGYSPATGFYRAPLQVLANGGVLVIDDFGRQHMSPRDMLNRWIAPLESRVDHLTLQTGQKFQLPFEVFIVFATNLRPSDLVDEAFLRRIQYKVHADSPSEDEFVQIFENYCRDRELAFDRAVVDALFEMELRPRKVQLRGCQPRDLVDHALSLAEYLGEPRVLTIELLSAVCQGYFVHDYQADLL